MILRKIALVTIVMLSLFSSLFALSNLTMAQNNDEPVSSDDRRTVDEGETAEQKRQKLQRRLEQRKAARPINLTPADRSRLLARCQPAQGLLRATTERINGVQSRRAQAYRNIIQKLTNLSNYLKQNDVDTAGLDAQIGELKPMLEGFNTKMAEYKQAVEDMASMDCAADPEAFRASLEAARTLRAELIGLSSEIKAYMNDTIKPTLLEIRNQQQETEGE